MILYNGVEWRFDEGRIVWLRRLLRCVEICLSMCMHKGKPHDMGTRNI